jgi:glucose-1-phosphate thymidylyltransferase
VRLIVLAAGYATRLYPLTRERPKHLLPVAGRPMIEYVLERLAPIAGIEGIHLVTNAKFAPQFREWAARSGSGITVTDDGTTDEETRLGAIGDLALVIEQEGIDDDVVVVAGDNLFSETLGGFGRFAREKDAPVLAVYDVGDLDAVRRYSAIAVDDDGRITSFVEKPEQPETTLIGIALYFYPRHSLPLVRRYLDEGNNPDQPGRLVQWLVPRTAVYAWPVPGGWYDIGSPETLAEADRVFSAQN